MTRGERRSLLVGLMFVSPWIVGFVAFTLYPVLASMAYSFCDYDVLSKPVWIGTLNYREMLTDSVFWQSLATHQKTETNRSSFQYLWLEF